MRGTGDRRAREAADARSAPAAGRGGRQRAETMTLVTTIPNVLAQRYASAQMVELWSPEHKVALERDLWIAVLRAQADLGIPVPEGTIEAYEAVRGQVDLASIAARERVTRHDVKARIEEFTALAGTEHIHKGMTSRDLTENVEQMQVRQALLLVRDRIVATLARLGALAAQYTDQPLTGRSHNVAAQTTTLGKRFASAAEELIVAYARIGDLIERYPCAGSRARSAPPRTCSTCSTATLCASPRSRRAWPPTWGSPRYSTQSARSTPAPWTTMCSRPSCRSRQDRPAWPPPSG